MGTQKSTGFTIIETLLFLAISGLMMVTMIAGTSLTLNTQRYHDSVRSLQSLLQEQYGALSSTENDRPSEFPCGLDGTATPQEVTGATQVRGQSKCEIFGRLVIIQEGDVAVYPVLAYRNESQKPTSGDDISLMQNVLYFGIGVDQSLARTTTLEWGAQIAWPAIDEAGTGQTTTPRSMSILFARSPDSGQVYTFSRDVVPAQASVIEGSFIRGLITVEAQEAQTICVDSAGLVAASTMAVYLTPFATGSSSVETRTNDYNQGIGSEVRC